VTERYDNLRALYQAARPDEEPTRTDLRAVRTAMMSAGIAAATFHASAAAGKLLALVPGGMKLFTLGQVVTYAAVGMAIGGGIAVVGVTAQRTMTTQTAVSAAPPVQSPPAKHETWLAPTPQASETEKTPQAELPPQENAAAPPSVAPARGSREPRSVPNATLPQVETPLPAPSPTEERTNAPRAPSLVSESRGLAEVQVALSAGNVGYALQLLDQQEKAFPSGSLAQERAAARVIALCAVHRADAELAKQRFMAAYPGSPLVRRVNAACKSQ
jgi:hypothetical protein